MYIMKYCILSS